MYKGTKDIRYTEDGTRKMLIFIVVPSSRARWFYSLVPLAQLLLLVTGAVATGTTVLPKSCVLHPSSESEVKHIDDGYHVHSEEVVLDGSGFDLTSCFDAQEGTDEEPDSMMRTHAGPSAAAQPMDENDIATTSGTTPKKKAKIDLQLLPNEKPFEFEIELVTTTTDASTGNIITGKKVNVFNDDTISKKKNDIAELNILLNKETNLPEAGSMHTKDAIYQIFVEEDGVTMRTQKILIKDLPLDDPQELRHHEELSREASKLDIEDTERNRGLLRAGTTSSSMLRTLPAPTSAERSLQDLEGIPEGWIIDVMVPYTQRTMCAIAQAGSPNNCLWNERRHQMVLNRIELAIAEANIAFENSGIPGRLRLVHTYMVKSSEFDEDGLTYADILRAMAYTTDGKMDDMTPLREQYGADIVSMFVDNQSSCGLAYAGTPVSKSWTFSAVNWVCATGYYSFAHEISHHMSARHDRRVEKCLLGCCTSSGGCDRYGYQDPLHRYRTIMSYNCPIEGGCPRVQAFSQPQYPYVLPSGSILKIGDTSHNNAKSITAAFRQVASYREHVTPSVTAATEAPTPSPSRCGNGICEGELGEDCRTCSQDCISGRYKESECGNGICEAEENCLNCVEDCGKRLDIYNDAAKYCCVGGPKAQVSSQNIFKGVSCIDQPYCLFNAECNIAPATETTFCCGNGVCEQGEGMWNCATDCKCNNDNVCNFWEDTSCQDCQGFYDIEESGLTVAARCMDHGRNCVGIVPDPCCGKCNTNTRVCEAV